ncbi:hypothetical protein [Streptomyces sp. NPDC056013]|uniref:hypothetical protein n=1 Tax=Streptomyces sp. NPDC056013 TaxID=3345680 RepID=UPI0035E2A52B
MAFLVGPSALFVMGRSVHVDGRGEYALEEVPLTLEGLDGIDLRPEEIAQVLRGAIGAGSLGVEASR